MVFDPSRPARFIGTGGLDRETTGKILERGVPIEPEGVSYRKSTVTLGMHRKVPLFFDSEELPVETSGSRCRVT